MGTPPHEASLPNGNRHFPENVQQVPGWGGYQSILNPAVPTICKIGYCPMIEGCCTDFTTVYTVFKHAQKVSAAMGQRDAVITFDLAIYIQAKQIQMKFPEEFSNTVVRLGGFHIALNYLPLLGKKFRSSGLEDLLIESGVYAAGTTSAIMKGKSYNGCKSAQTGHGRSVSPNVECFYRVVQESSRR